MAEQHLITAEFFGSPVSIIDHAGQQWLTAEQAGRCLGYSEKTAASAIRKLFERHQDEFYEGTVQSDAPFDTGVIEVMTPGGIQQCRIFSATGCQKLGFFARTPKAKDFRTWAAKVLAGRAPAPVPAEPAAPALAPATDAALQTLAAGMSTVLAQMNVTGKYIELLEMNQTAKRRITREVVVEVFTLRAQGMNATDIARLLRVPRAAVSSIIKEKFAALSERQLPAERSLDDIMEDWLSREKAKLMGSLSAPEGGV